MRTTEFEKQVATARAAGEHVLKDDEVFLGYPTLRRHGIEYTRVHLRRLIVRGLFPAPVLLSPNRIAWRRSDLIAWMAARPTAPMPKDAKPEAAA
jgi:hypothetical protein